MANASKFIYPLNKSKDMSYSSSLEGASSFMEYITTLPPQFTSSSSSTFLSTANNNKQVVGGEDTSIEDEVELSKVHWSQLAEHMNSGDDKMTKLNNMEFFKSLQKHPTCGHFFCTFGDGGIFDMGKLEVGEKFAEGGQAELYHTHVTWKDPKKNSFGQKFGMRFVLKVFKKEMLLQDLQKQWPEGMFKAYEEKVEWLKSIDKSELNGPWKIFCDIMHATLLEDGRFAFLMVRKTEDLQALINRKMKERRSYDRGPFPMERTFEMMYYIARGMDWLHNLNIVHRDLKASNVLHTQMYSNNGNAISYFVVADFECSIGVVGTGFFRAPEILQAIKDKVVNKRPNIFTKAGDVYSYGMVCYEILTGKHPFEGHPTNDYDLVLKGQELEVPHYIDEWLCELLHRCWQLDPIARPTFQEIIKVLEANSKDCLEVKRLIEAFEELPLGKDFNYKYKY